MAGVLLVSSVSALFVGVLRRRQKRSARHVIRAAVMLKPTAKPFTVPPLIVVDPAVGGGGGSADDICGTQLWVVEDEGFGEDEESATSSDIVSLGSNELAINETDDVYIDEIDGAGMDVVVDAGADGDALRSFLTM